MALINKPALLLEAKATGINAVAHREGHPEGRANPFSKKATREIRTMIARRIRDIEALHKAAAHSKLVFKVAV